MNAINTAKRHTGLISSLACTLALVLACMAALAFAPQDAHAALSMESGPREGATFTVDGNLYKVTDRYEGRTDPGEVILVKYGSTKVTPKINTVTYRGMKYEVDIIGKNAFNNARGHRITSVVIGANVDKIGGRAFYGCKKLRVINISKTDALDIEYSRRTGKYYLDEVSIGQLAFGKAGTKNMVVKCGNNNAGYKKIVKNMLQKKGLPKTMKVTR